MNDKISIAAVIQSAVTKLADDILRRHPDSKHNQGRYMAEAFVWDEIQSVAKGKSEDAWKRMVNEGIYTEPDRKEASDKLLATSPHLELHGKVTVPVKRFSADELAKKLKKQYKIPEATTKQLVDQSKVGTNGNLLLSIKEKSS